MEFRFGENQEAQLDLNGLFQGYKGTKGVQGRRGEPGPVVSLRPETESESRETQTLNEKCLRLQR